MSKHHNSEIIVENGIEYVTDGYHKISRKAFLQIIEDYKKERENETEQSEDKI